MPGAVASVASESGLVGSADVPCSAHAIVAMPLCRSRWPPILIKAVAAVNSNTVVVMNTGLAVITKDWINNSNIKSVLEMWNPGQEGGTATARLLLGQANPSGHTAVTWQVNDSDSIFGYNQETGLYTGDTAGTHQERLGQDGAATMTQGIYSGYRYYDQLDIPVQYPFGWGLSYTSFKYSNLKVTQTADGGLDVTVKIKNTGKRDGKAVPQVYLGAPSIRPAGVQFAKRALAQFDKVSLKAGEATSVTMHVAKRALQFWDTRNQQWRTASGVRTVSVGYANAEYALPLEADITVAAAGDVVCTNQALSATYIDGNLIVPAGAWCDVVHTTIKGNVIVKGSGLRLEDSKVTGDVIATAVSAANDPMSSGHNSTCSNTIGGSIKISASGTKAPWNIGGCGANTVKGGIVFTNNAASANTITSNKVTGALTCTSNRAVVAVKNSVAGAVACK